MPGQGSEARPARGQPPALRRLAGRSPRVRGSALSALRPETPLRSASAVGRGVNDALHSQGVPGPTRAPLFSATEFTDALPVCGTPWRTHSQRGAVSEAQRQAGGVPHPSHRAEPPPVSSAASGECGRGGGKMPAAWAADTVRAPAGFRGPRGDRCPPPRPQRASGTRWGAQLSAASEMVSGSLSPRPLPAGVPPHPQCGAHGRRA